MKTTLVNYRTYNLDRSKVIPIDRRSIFGNPYPITKDCTREQSIKKYRKYFYERIKTDVKFKEEVLKLAGKIIICWCSPLPCHGDVIIEYLENLNQGNSQRNNS